MKGLFIISGLGVLAMLAEIFKFKKLLYPLVLIGILAAYVTNFMEWNNNYNIEMFGNMMRFDNVALAFSGVILVTAFFWFILANDYFEQDHVTDHFALVLFALVGAIMLTGFSNMTTLFLGIEILSIPMYVLAASRKRDLASNEAGFKYLIFYAGVLMVLVAMLFKVSAAPFHFWAPDVYEGSPTVITALMSTIVKTAAFAAFMRLFLVVFGGVNESWSMVLAVVIALSLVVSNITAATQQSVKRMLAYSSISHAAFMLMAILANQRGMASVSAIH